MQRTCGVAQSTSDISAPSGSASTGPSLPRHGFEPRLEKVAPSKNRLGLAQLDYFPREIEQCALFGGQIPIEPGNRRILTISVIVSVLGLPEFITGQEHRHPLRKKQRGQKIPLLPRTHGANAGIIGRALHATIPTLVVVRPIAVLLAVGFVMLVIVTDQVPQGETIVRGHEVQARAWTTAIVRVKIAAARQPRS